MFDAFETWGFPVVKLGRTKLPVMVYKGQWEQGCSLYMATDLGPFRATSEKKIYM